MAMTAMNMISNALPTVPRTELFVLCGNLKPPECQLFKNLRIYISLSPSSEYPMLATGTITCIPQDAVRSGPDSTAFMGAPNRRIMAYLLARYRPKFKVAHQYTHMVRVHHAEPGGVVL